MSYTVKRNVQEVARKTGLSIPTAYRRYALFLKKEIDLKMLFAKDLRFNDPNRKKRTVKRNFTITNGWMVF